ncbi:hypothetical protein BC826DRAFT_970526 [Russula brevipes]|nr:hypothetical protein BC826DRAFT_970526 [Russula brevipes]
MGRSERMESDGAAIKRGKRGSLKGQLIIIPVPILRQLASAMKGGYEQAASDGGALETEDNRSGTIFTLSSSDQLYATEVEVARDQQPRRFEPEELPYPERDRKSPRFFAIFGDPVILHACPLLTSHIAEHLAIEDKPFEILHASCLVPHGLMPRLIDFIACFRDIRGKSTTRKQDLSQVPRAVPDRGQEVQVDVESSRMFDVTTAVISIPTRLGGPAALSGPLAARRKNDNGSTHIDSAAAAEDPGPGLCRVTKNGRGRGEVGASSSAPSSFLYWDLIPS